jgi:hypothetical protein
MTARKGKPAPPAARDEEAEQRDTLATMLEEFGPAGHTVKLYRQSDTPPRRMDYVATLELTPTLVEDVQAKFGGGVYRGQVHNETGFMRGRSINFSIAGRAKIRDEEEGRPGGDRITRLEEKIDKLSEKPANGDGVERVVNIITGIATALTPLLAPLLARNGGGDVVATLTLVKDAEERGERRGQQLGTLLAGGGGSTDSLADVAKAYLPQLVTLVSQNVKVRQQQNGATPVAEVAPPAPPALPPGEVLPREYDWLPTLRPVYGQLAREADENNDPGLIADYALSKMPAPLLEAIQRASMLPDFRDRMRAELATVAAAHSEWLDEFLARIIEDCAPEVPAPPTSTRTAKGKKK